MARIRVLNPSKVGYVKNDGTVQGKNHSTIGYAKGVDMYWSAVTFFFFDFLPDYIKENTTLVNKCIGLLILTLAVSNVFAIPEAQKSLNFIMIIFMLPMFITFYNIFLVANNLLFNYNSLIIYKISVYLSINIYNNIIYKYING